MNNPILKMIDFNFSDNAKSENTALHLACQIPSLCLINELSLVPNLNPLIFNQQLMLPMDCVPQNYLTSRKRAMELTMNCLRQYFRYKSYTIPVRTSKLNIPKFNLMKKSSLKLFSFVNRRQAEDNSTFSNLPSTRRNTDLREGKSAQKILSLSIRSSKLKISIPASASSQKHRDNSFVSPASNDESKRKDIRSMNFMVRMPKSLSLKQQNGHPGSYLLEVQL
jgi:hypothetical protein